MSEAPRPPSLWQRARQQVRQRVASPAVGAVPGPAAAAAPAARFARFRIDRPLGQGGMGQLYAAWDEAGQRPVALKLLPPGRGDDDPVEAEARRRFLDEARLAARLDHPHIVRLHEAGEHQGRLYLAMELVPGTDLARYTRPARLLPEALVLRLGAQVAAALAHAHDADILHRDIKPANVIVDLAGPRAKVGDFGLARAADMDRSRSGLLVGTPAYMSPEQAAGAALDGRSDLYSLGVLLYQLLLGRLPYEAENLGRLLAQIALARPEPLSHLRPDLPAALGALVDALLQKSPSARPAHADEVARALEALATDLGAPPLEPGRAPELQGGSAGEPRHNRPS